MNEKEVDDVITALETINTEEYENIRVIALALSILLSRFKTSVTAISDRPPQGVPDDHIIIMNAILKAKDEYYQSTQEEMKDMFVHSDELDILVAHPRYRAYITSEYSEAAQARLCRIGRTLLIRHYADKFRILPHGGK